MLIELDKMCLYEEELKATLDEYQMDIFKKFDDAHCKAVTLYDEDVFRYGFQLAAHIFVEVLGNTGSKWFHGE